MCGPWDLMGLLRTYLGRNLREYATVKYPKKKLVFLHRHALRETGVQFPSVKNTHKKYNPLDWAYSFITSDNS
jgi:hypothetical protein